MNYEITLTRNPSFVRAKSILFVQVAFSPDVCVAKMRNNKKIQRRIREEDGATDCRKEQKNKVLKIKSDR